MVLTWFKMKTFKLPIVCLMLFLCLTSRTVIGQYPQVRFTIDYVSPARSSNPFYGSRAHIGLSGFRIDGGCGSSDGFIRPLRVSDCFFGTAEFSTDLSVDMSFCGRPVIAVVRKNINFQCPSLDGLSISVELNTSRWFYQLELDDWPWVHSTGSTFNASLIMPDTYGVFNVSMTIPEVIVRTGKRPDFDLASEADPNFCAGEILYFRNDLLTEEESIGLAEIDYQYKIDNNASWIDLGAERQLIVPKSTSLTFRARVTHNRSGLTGDWGPENTIFLFKAAPELTIPPQAASDGFLTQREDAINESEAMIIQNVTSKGESTGKFILKNVSNEVNDFRYAIIPSAGPAFNVSSFEVTESDPLVFPDDFVSATDPGADPVPNVFQNGFPAGEYEIQIMNFEEGNLRCFNNYFFYIREPEFVLSDSVVMLDYEGAVNVSCIEAGDGQITVRGKGGIAPYTFKLIGRTTSGVVRDLPLVDENTPGYDPNSHEYVFTGLDALDNSDPIDYELTITDVLGAVQITANEFDNDPLQLTVPEDLRFEGEVQRTLNGDGFDLNCSNVLGAIGLQTIGGVIEHRLQILNALEEEVFNQTIPGTSLREFQVTGLAAGEYRALLSDANRSEATCIEELTFEVTAPETLTLGLTSQKLCSGDKSGSILARANGGIPEGAAYTYALRNIDTDEGATLTGPEVTFTDLTQGTYEVTVTDKYLCTFSDQITIVDPEAIEAFFTLTDIVCYGDSTGVINASLSGGALPLQATWYNSENTELSGGTVNANGVSAIVGVPAGTYRLLIEDANGCSVERFSELTQPAPVSVELGGGTTICPGMTHRIDAGTGGIQYEWTLNEEVIGRDPTITVSEAGLYTVTVTDADGCEGVDAFELTVLEDPLNTDFGMPSEAYVGDTVAIIDITWPLPDSVSWNWDENVQYYLSEENCEKFIFPEAGSYNLTLKTFLGECQDELVKTITIVEGEEQGNIGGRLGYEALIEEFVVYPNPNQGDFKVRIDLSTAKDIRLTMIRQGAATQVFSEQWSGQSTYVLPFQLMSLTPGVYILMLETGGEKETIRVMIH